MSFLKSFINLIFGTKEKTEKASQSGGSSVVFTALQNQETLNTLRNQRIDNINLSLTPVFGMWGTKLFIEVIRATYTGKSTIGVMYVNDSEECYTLEDNDRLGKGQKKLGGITAIPEGTYNVKITYSSKFRRKLPIIQNVPGFRGVRIHPGNTDKDTAGCLLVGETRGKNFIGRSRKAFNSLFKKIEEAQRQRKKITITVRGRTL